MDDEEKRKMKCIHSLLNGKKPFMSEVSHSETLKKVKLFLPQMKEASIKLEKEMLYRRNSDFDIENIKDAEDNVVEMELALFQYDSDGSESNFENEYSNNDQVKNLIEEIPDN